MSVLQISAFHTHIFPTVKLFAALLNFSTKTLIQTVECSLAQLLPTSLTVLNRSLQTGDQWCSVSATLISSHYQSHELDLGKVDVTLSYSKSLLNMFPSKFLSHAELCEE